jgi:hypothetical protein
MIKAEPETAGIGSVFGVFVFLAMLSVVLALGYSYTHDEELYVTPALLAVSQRLYADFFYHQTPLYPVILAPVLAAVQPDQVYLAARAFSAVVGFALMLAIYRTLRELSADRFVSLVLVAVVALSWTVLPALSVARNDSLAALFGTASLCLMVRGLSNPRSFALLFAAGALSACAVLTKATWAFLPFVAGAFLLLMFLQDRSSSLLRLAGYVTGGAAATALVAPVVVADFATAMFDFTTFNARATPDWYIRVGQANLLEWHVILYRYARFLAQPLGALALVAVAVLWRYGKRDVWAGLAQSVRTSRGLLFVALCTLGAAASALLPKALSIYYFAPVVVMAALLVGAVLAHFRPQLSVRQRAAVALIALLASVPGLVAVAHVSSSFFRGEGGVARLEEDALTLRSHLCELGRPALVATLSPIRVLVAGHQIYPELAAGPFVFRSAHLWTPEELASFRVAGPQTVDRLFEARRPDAIYVGHERTWSAASGIELDEALARWAGAHGYRELAFPGSKVKKTFVAPTVPASGSCR